MRAMILERHGGNDAFAFRSDYPRPRAATGEVVLRVRACTLNYHDVFTRNGMPGIKIEMPRIVGIDLAGDVIELGPGVADFKIGDRVVVDPIDRVKGGLVGETRDGGLAEFIALPAHHLVPLPAEVGYAEAAALPCAYGTAYRMMIERGRVQAGETVLVLGASGGVGTCCVQLAVQKGATVAVCASSQAKLDRLKALGATHLIDYAKNDFLAESQRLFGKARVFGGTSGGVDVVVNFTGGDTWVKSLRTLRKQGRLLTCGATAGFAPTEDIRFIWTFELNIVGSNGWSRQDVIDLVGMVQAGTLQPVLHPERFRLEQSREAMQLLDDRGVIGKIVVEP